jgi:hypothetical protein
MPILLVRDVPGDRLEVCSGVRETLEPAFRSGSFVPTCDWRTVGDLGESEAWDCYKNKRPLRENIALIRVFSAPQNSAHSAQNKAVFQVQDSECLDAMCRKLSMGCPLEHKGRWLATGGGASLSTTRERGNGQLIGLHIDRWERKPAAMLSGTRNRLCLNLGPHSRYLVYLAVDPRQIAASRGCAPTDFFTTADAQRYMREHPTVHVFRLRIDPGEAYIAPTEYLIHDGLASSTTGEWVYTIFGHLANTELAEHLSVV